jgi:hypothetical protein
MTIDKCGNKFWRKLKDDWCLHRINGPALELQNGYKSWYVNGEWLGDNDEGFWALWDTLTDEQKQDPVLLSYLPGEI